MGTSTESDKAPGEEQIESVLAAGTPRVTPCGDSKEQTFTALRTEWQAHNRMVNRNRRMALFGIAASVTVAAVLVIHTAPDEDELLPDANAAIARVTGGDVRINGNSARLNSTTTIPPFQLGNGDVISTGDGAKVSLTWNSNGSLRIGTRSELQVLGANRVRLVRGDMYFDSRLYGSTNAAEIEVETPLGRIRHVGTQFIASLKSGGVDISVREGAVTFNDGSRSVTVHAGQSAFVDASYDVAVNEVQPSDARWQWASQIAPLMSTDGKSTLDLIQWISRETGKSVEYASDGARQFAAKDHLRGMGALEPMQALSILSVATGLDFEIDDHTIRVTEKRH